MVVKEKSNSQLIILFDLVVFGDILFLFLCQHPQKMAGHKPNQNNMPRSAPRHFGDQALPVQSPCGGLVKHLSVEAPKTKPER